MIFSHIYPKSLITNNFSTKQCALEALIKYAAQSFGKIQEFLSICMRPEFFEYADGSNIPLEPSTRVYTSLRCYISVVAVLSKLILHRYRIGEIPVCTYLYLVQPIVIYDECREAVHKK